MNDIVLECKNLCKSFIDGKQELKVLSNINLQIKRGSQVAIMGRSGSGKTTLLQLLGGLDKPSTGEVIFGGKIGFIYQLHHLLPEFSALENVALPLLIHNATIKQANQTAKELIAAVGLSARLEHRPGQLSGGERQRIAIARALSINPDVVLADEPTGNLDAENAEIAFNLMQKLSKERGLTFIIVTHDADLAKRMDHTYYLKNGMLDAI